MPVTFPTIQPTSREFTDPEWAQTSRSAQSGVVTGRLWGSLPGDARLRLSFANITDDNAALILTAHRAAKGSVDTLTLPSVIFQGASAALLAFIQTGGTGLVWIFSRGTRPTVRSVRPGRSTVDVELTAELR